MVMQYKIVCFLVTCAMLLAILNIHTCSKEREDWKEQYDQLKKKLEQQRYNDAYKCLLIQSNLSNQVPMYQIFRPF